MKKILRTLVVVSGILVVLGAWTNPTLDDFKTQRELDGKVSRTLTDELFQKDENKGWGQALLSWGLNALSNKVMEVHACRQDYILFSKFYIRLTPPESDDETIYFTAYGFLGRIWPIEEKKEVPSVAWKSCERMDL
ncbi:MAG TPA: hypothetical protein DCE41_10305 [Cytophagales bacterium]|nr:hypothetical protein [Cytophagales bacterium]HAA17330.1 hypothetical protein [Cytophagales bacterium]HAP62991.1 hypothetical protein [Cytophagales bacterium]